MNEEEAIEKLKEVLNTDPLLGTVDFQYSDVETVLNLLEKKDIDIIEAKEANRQLSVELQKKDEQIEKLKQSKIRQLERYKKYKENIDNQHEKIYEDLVEEIEFKDKIIDLMEEEILNIILNTYPLADYNVDLDCENKCKDDYKACWKQYFEDKVTDINVEE